MMDVIYVMAGVAVLAAWAALVRIEGQRLLTLALRVVLPAIFLAVIFGGGGTLASGIALYLVFLAGPLLIGAYVFAWIRSRTATQTYVGTLSVVSVLFGAAFVLHFRH